MANITPEMLEHFNPDMLVVTPELIDKFHATIWDFNEAYNALYYHIEYLQKYVDKTVTVIYAEQHENV